MQSVKEYKENSIRGHPLQILTRNSRRIKDKFTTREIHNTPEIMKVIVLKLRSFLPNDFK